MRIRTGNKRAKRPRQICRQVGHAEEFGYGFAFGGGIGSYTFCKRCDVFLGKVFDTDDEDEEEAIRVET